MVLPFRVLEINDQPDSFELFKEFYDSVYVSEFPDPDERESLTNIFEYLSRKRTGWYGANNYHVLLATVEDRPVGCTIADYLVEPDAATLEFLTVSPPWRRCGIGKALRSRMENLLADDAKRANKHLDYVVAEMNDPRRTDLAADNMDPVERALLWHHWGYRVIDFDYIQPALSPMQAPVRTLRLIVRIRAALDQDRIPAARLLSIVANYLRWAMRIDQPEQAPEFQEMVRSLLGGRQVAVLNLATYAKPG